MASKEISILLVAKDLASGNINKVKGELGGLSTQGKVAAIGLGTAERAATGLSGALSHAKGFLTSNLGLLGLGAGAFSLAGGFEAGISRAEEMALAVEKLTALTGMGAHEASQYLAVFEKFGVDGTTTVRLLGFMEKAIGANTLTTAKAEAFQTKYGIALVDSSGKAKSAGDVFNELLAFENGNATASQKAATAAALLGRNYVALLPVLKQSPKAFAEAAQEADKLGLTLKTAQDVKNVQAFIAAQRNAKDALAGLEVQVGLLVMPDLTGVLKTFTSFVVQNKTQILGFFQDALGFAKQVGAAVMTIGGAFKSAWEAIPPQFRQLLLEGFVANKAIKMVFGIDPIKIAEGGIGSALKGALGGLFQRGASPAAPVYTKEVGVAGVPGAPGGGGIGSKLATAVSIVSIAADALAVFTTWQNVNAQSSAAAQAAADNETAWLKKQPSKADLERGLAAVKTGIDQITSNPLNVLVQGDALDKLRQMQSDIQQQLNAMNANTQTGKQIISAVDGIGPKISNAFNSGGIIGAVLSLIPHIDAVARYNPAAPGNDPSKATHQHGGKPAPGGYVDKGPGRGGGRASGGPVWPGMSYDVGERGRERLTMYPGGGGYVTPMGGQATSIVVRPQVHVAVTHSARDTWKAGRRYTRVGNGSSVSID